MAAKPGSVPRWANVGGAIVIPPDGKKDVGWVAGEKPPAQYLNWFQNLDFQWLDYLNDGDLEGDHSIDGNVSTTGTLEADGLITGNAGVVAALDQDMEVSGAGRYRHGSQFLQIAGGEGFGQNVTVAGAGEAGSMILGALTDILYIPIRIPSGKRIISISAIVTDNLTGATQISMELYEKSSHALLSIQGPDVSAGDGTDQVLELLAINEIMVGAVYLVRFIISANNNCYVHRVVVEFDD
jgi:hypothetical protein